MCWEKKPESTSPWVQKSDSKNTMWGAELEEPEVIGECEQWLQSQPPPWQQRVMESQNEGSDHAGGCTQFLEERKGQRLFLRVAGKEDTSASRQHVCVCVK